MRKNAKSPKFYQLIFRKKNHFYQKTNSKSKNKSRRTHKTFFLLNIHL